ncbi:septal ring lytic transglycosylase RlpA family protein [bacterium]|nr:septal ring lytic transglycosylase RlpA family protein [bacterium]
MYLIITALITFTFQSCTPAPRFRDKPVKRGHYKKPSKSPKQFKVGQILTGEASWYGPKFNGRKTANGEVFDMNGKTAAHKELPFDTWVEVTNLANGKKVNVRINDRGPFVKKRILDLSKGAAVEIGLDKMGVTKVEIRIISLGDK